MKSNINIVQSLISGHQRNADREKCYSSPLIEQIIIDHEISLSLQSDPPAGPDELTQQNTENFRNSPFENQQFI